MPSPPAGIPGILCRLATQYARTGDSLVSGTYCSNPWAWFLLRLAKNLHHGLRKGDEHPSR
jgi:hypothetical protein